MILIRRLLSSYERFNFWFEVPVIHDLCKNLFESEWQVFIREELDADPDKTKPGRPDPDDRRDSGYADDDVGSSDDYITKHRGKRRQGIRPLISMKGWH